MGEEAVSLKVKEGDGKMEECCPRQDLKRPRVEYGDDGAESPTKKPAVDSNGCVLEENEVVTPCEKLVEECLDAIDVETVHEKNVEECLNEENSFGVELKTVEVVAKCSNECVIGEVEVNASHEKPDECTVSTTEEEKKAAIETSAYVVDTVEIESLHDKAIKEPLGGEELGRVELKQSLECVVDTTEELNPNKKLAVVCLNDENTFANCENSFRVDSICSNGRGLDSSTLEAISLKLTNESSSNDSFSNVEPKVSNEQAAVEPLNDENLSREELKFPSDTLDSIAIVPNDQKPVINLTNDVNEFRTEATLYSTRVVDATEAETSNVTPTKELSSGDNFSSGGLRQSGECIGDIIEMETSNKKPKLTSPDDENFSTIEKKLPNEHIADATESDAPSKKVSFNDSLSRIQLDESVVDVTEVNMVDMITVKESLNNGNSTRVELKSTDEYVIDAVKAETPDNKPKKETSDDRNTFREESKCLEMDAIEVETPDKKPVKRLLTESSSGVLDLNVSPPETTSSSPTVSDQSVEELSRFGCGGIVFSAGESSAEIADKQGLSKSEMILEGSKSPSSCRVRRIKIKFSKNENGNDDVLSPQGDSSSMEVDNDFSYTPLPIEVNMSSSNVKKLKNGKLEKHIKDVKNFLSSGILEGVEVKYINQEKKLLEGIIKNCGYLCGCALCNSTKVYDANEFEHHAGCKSTCPNDHVFLNNGKSIHRIVEELKYTPVNSLDSTIRDLVGPVFNEKAYLGWKESLEVQKNEKKSEKDEQSHLHFVDLSQTTRSCSSEVSEDNLVTVSRSMVPKLSITQKMSTTQGISIEKKRVPNKLSTLQNPTFGCAKKKLKKRDNILHRLLFMPNGLPDGAELAYCARGERVLCGYKQGSGILCNCCSTEISPSQFESHAGHSAKRQPYRHIYTSDGVSLHDVSLTMAKAQSLAISEDGDMCSVCGDGGNLIVCDACYKNFHAACLDLERIPEGEWCCPRCQDKLGISRKLASSEGSGCGRPITIRLTRVVKAPPTDVGGCVVCRAPDFSVLKFDDRTIMLCDQCEKEYHVGCLRERGICDLKVLPEGKWFCSEDCCRIHATLQKLICNGEKVVPPYMSNTINRKLTEKRLFAEVGEKVEWQVLSGKFRAENHRSLLSRAVTIFRDSFDPIVVEQTGLDLIPAMVCGESVGKQDFGGIYCAVLVVKSVVVSAGLFRIFGTEVAELPLVATTKENRGKGYFQVLFASIMKLLMFLNVEKLVLPAAEKAESIWIQKFGFRKMSEGQFQKYTKDIQLISFQGTVMLEKDVPRKQQQSQPPEK